MTTHTMIQGTLKSNLNPWGDVSWSPNSTKQYQLSQEEIEESDITLEPTDIPKLFYFLRQLSASIESINILIGAVPDVIFLPLSSSIGTPKLRFGNLNRLHFSPLTNWDPTYRLEQLFSGSSTAFRNLPREIDEEFQAIFTLGQEEAFEDGMESEFSRKLLVLIDRYGEMAIGILADLIMGEKVGREIASEVLSWIGHIRHPASRLSRRRFLERCLFQSNCRSAIVRYGAVLGLSYMDDPLALPTIKVAIEQEEIQSLKQDEAQLLAQLELTKKENA